MTDKSLDVVNVKDAQIKISDIKVVGNGDAFQLLCKASSKDQGWMKSTKAMHIENVGCVVQSSTQQGDNVAEALVFVPDVAVVKDINGGRKLKSNHKFYKGGVDLINSRENLGKELYISSRFATAKVDRNDAVVEWNTECTEAEKEDWCLTAQDFCKYLNNEKS